MSKHKQTEIFEDVLNAFLSRRQILRGAVAVGAGAVAGCSQDSGGSAAQGGASPVASGLTSASGPSTLTFTEVAHGIDDQFVVADGYSAQVLVRWGDPIFPNVGEFDPHALDEASQLQRFGYNNDFIGFVSLPYGSKNSDHGILVVNHEYTSTKIMYPGSPSSMELSASQVATDIVAHGLSVVEIKKTNGQWLLVKESPLNRRITPHTPMQMTGAAAGSERLKTAISFDGVHTLGTYGNCAGGVTPWGTILTGEENVDSYFMGDYTAADESENYGRFHGGSVKKNWGKFHDRWDIEKSPQEFLHMGWVVEIDPYDPNSVPKKRTGLGRCKHEGSNVYVDADNRVVAYTGDDQRFEYIYKFVSKYRYQPDNRTANLDLLEEGTLYVAKFHSNGSLTWLPLDYGVGPLTEANGFHSQADVCLDTRKAGDLVGATPMDRPEDVDVNPVNGRVYAMLTNNRERTEDQIDAVNPRAHNGHGQVLEFWPESGDHTANQFVWDLFLVAGDPAKGDTKYHPDVSASGWLSCPDNVAFDQIGNAWIATDGGQKWGISDGVWATEVTGEHRALTKHFLRTPFNAELCGPFFTPNDENFFVSIQHPGEQSSFEQPTTRWPDFVEGMPPRPAVVVITKKEGGRVGS